MSLVLLWLLLAEAQQPSPHTEVYYNARMALREGNPLEAARLWLLRNALESQTETVSPHDGDFHSVTWAALGELGVCADGLDEDQDGAGLWPVALHNWTVINMNRRAATQLPRAFDAFTVGRQQRLIAIGDVLGFHEMQTARFVRGRCYRPRLELMHAGERPWASLQDRQVTARLLHHLLLQAQQTLSPNHVRGHSVIAARLFDINLKLTDLGARQARQETRRQDLMGRQLDLSLPSLEDMRLRAPTSTLDLESEAAHILQTCIQWPTEEWMALDAERRRFLFQHARDFGGDPHHLSHTALGIIDALTMRGEGEEVSAWIALWQDPNNPDNRAPIWDGERGALLLALDEDSGFTERAAIALHRSIALLEQGELHEALRLMAYALQQAPASRDAETITNLSRRWLTHIAARFTITDALVAMLQEVTPRREANLIYEDLLWNAAFHADNTSFQRGLAALDGQTALRRRVVLLAHLAEGNRGAFLRALDQQIRTAPGEYLRFLAQFIAYLEQEDASVRAAHIPTLIALHEQLIRLTEDDRSSSRQRRNAESLANQSQSILEGLGEMGFDLSERTRARTLSADAVVFAGSVRLAPADPLPWPFVETKAAAPSIFSPIQLRPVEWHDDDGSLVFGWDITE